MPMLKPKPGQSQDDFISKCMSFLDDDNSDLDQDQRLAACNAAWDKKSFKFVSERRDYEATFEVRFDDDKRPIIEGYAAIFNSLSHDLGGFKEKIAPGAFSGTKKGDTYLFWNHNSDKVLGRRSAGTLKLKEDDKGLWIEAKPPRWASSYVETVQRGDVTGMSFGFIAEADEWDHKKNIRTLTKIAELPEVSIVPFPAYPATDVSIALRSKALSRGRDLNEYIKSADIDYLERLADKLNEAAEKKEKELKTSLEVIEALEQIYQEGKKFMEKTSPEGTHSRSNQARIDHTHSRLVEYQLGRLKRRIIELGGKK